MLIAWEKSMVFWVWEAKLIEILIKCGPKLSIRIWVFHKAPKLNRLSRMKRSKIKSMLKMNKHRKSRHKKCLSHNLPPNQCKMLLTKLYRLLKNLIKTDISPTHFKNKIRLKKILTMKMRIWLAFYRKISMILAGIKLKSFSHTIHLSQHVKNSMRSWEIGKDCCLFL